MNLLLFGADIGAKVHADSETLTGLAREQFWGILICFIAAVIGMSVFSMLMSTKRETSRDSIINETFKNFSDRTVELTAAITDLRGVIEKRFLIIETKFNSIEKDFNDVSEGVNSVSAGFNNLQGKVNDDEEKIEEHSNILSEHDKILARHDAIIHSHDETLSSFVKEQPKKRSSKKNKEQ